MLPLDAARQLSKRCDALTFQPPVAATYNPLSYAWDGHAQYVRRFGDAPKPVLMLGMNPGPWGMGQTGVPFGDVDKVQDMGIDEIEVEEPESPVHGRPVHGLACERNEVSGTRLYGGLQEIFGSLEDAYQHLFIANYCPLLFFDEDGQNLTPPRLRKADREALFEVCDEHLDALVDHFEPRRIVGIGRFAERRANAVLEARGTQGPEVTYLLHPSPANPHANKEKGAYWQRQLAALFDDLAP